MSVLGWGLKRSKGVIDELAENGAASVECPDEKTASELAAHVRDLGAIVSLDAG